MCRSFFHNLAPSVIRTSAKVVALPLGLLPSSVDRARVQLLFAFHLCLKLPAYVARAVSYLVPASLPYQVSVISV